MNKDHTQRKHARLSASRAERFMTCPGSVYLESQVPEEPSGEAAAIGTAIHELAEGMLRGDVLKAENYPGEQWNMAKAYVQFIDDLVENPRKKLIEVNVDDGLKTLHAALGGTADAVLVDGDHLHVIDLKTGRVPVSAENNKQLLTYAVGVMRKFKAPQTITCTMHIFQPMAGHSQWTVSGERLVQHANELKAAATLALTHDAPTHPSPDACKYCRAKPLCPSMRTKVQDNARKDFAPNTTVTPEMLELADIASSWAEAVQAAAKKQLKAFVDIDGWALRPGRKTKFWKAEALAVEALKDHPEAFDLKSPSAVQKLGIALSDDLVGEKQSAESLVREKRQD